MSKNGPPKDLDKGDLWDKYLRSLADQENMRKRHGKALEEARESGMDTALREVLPIVDDLRRGSQAAQEARGRLPLGRVRKDWGVVASKAQQTLRNLGVEAFESSQQDFDPARMEAIAQIPTHELEAGKVTGEVERGYTRGQRLLRPAKVAVAVDPKEEKDG